MKDFSKVVDQHRHRVYTFAYYSLGNHEDAEDATQEVLIRLWQNWRKLERGTLSAWLTRVTRNVCIDRTRQRRAYTLRVVAGAPGGETTEGVSVEPSPENQTETNELRVHIRSALTTIKEPYRSIMIMREIQELTYGEIANALDLPLNTVKSYLHRGRRMLRDQLKETLSYDRT